MSRSPTTTPRFARARAPLEDCTTHFVSTRAYGEHPAVLTDLNRFDSQSHGHHHVIYRDPAANRRNLKRRLHRTLAESGMTPVGFAALARALGIPGSMKCSKSLDILYSSDFQLGFDDLPFFPGWGDRFSTILQVPIHPVCEGLHRGGGRQRSLAVAQYLARVVRSKINACEPAFVYGHPERRLARYPEVLAELASVIAHEPYVWRGHLDRFCPMVALAVRAALVGLVETRRPIRDSVRRLERRIPDGRRDRPGPARGDGADHRPENVRAPRGTRL